MCIYTDLVSKRGELQNASPNRIPLVFLELGIHLRNERVQGVGGGVLAGVGSVAKKAGGSLQLKHSIDRKNCTG